MVPLGSSDAPVCRYEEIYAPEVKDFVYITDRAYTESQIREMEMKILEALAFELGRPLPLPGVF